MDLLAGGILQQQCDGGKGRFLGCWLQLRVLAGLFSTTVFLMIRCGTFQLLGFANGGGVEDGHGHVNGLGTGIGRISMPPDGRSDASDRLNSLKLIVETLC